MFKKKIRTSTGGRSLTVRWRGASNTPKYRRRWPKIRSTTRINVETEEMTEPRPRDQASPKVSLVRLPEVIVIMLRTILITLAAAFRTYLFPYIPEQLIEPVPPRTVEEAVANSKRAVDSLRVTSLESVSERRKNDVLREIGLIEKSIERLERIHAASIN